MGIFKIKDPTTHEWIPEEMYHGAVDSAMSDTSENPVQNKIVKEYIDTHAQSDWEETDTSDPSYIKNKPVIPEPTEQVQANWNETDTTSKAYIQNKPNIPVPVPQMQADWEQDDTTEVDYIKNKPTIPAETPIATTSIAGKVKPDGTTITVDSDGTISASASSQVQVDWNQTDTTQVDYIKNKPVIPAPTTQEQSDWNQTDTTAVDYIKNKPSIPTLVQSDWNETDTTDPAYIQNKPTIPTETPIATTQVAGKVKPDGTTITVDSNGEIKASNTSVDITNRFNQIFGDNTPPSPPAFPPVKTNFVLPTSNLPINRTKSTVLKFFYVENNGTPKYIEVYVNVPQGMSIFGWGLLDDGTLCLGINNGTSSTGIDIKYDVYNASNGSKTSSDRALTNSWRGCYIAPQSTNMILEPTTVSAYSIYKITFPNKYVICQDVPNLVGEFVAHNTGARQTLVPVNTNWIYTVNAGSTDTTPWQTLNDRVDALENNPYALPIATTEILGGIKPDGTTITVDANGVASASGGTEQVQADWNQTDNTAVDFIKNKPTIPDVSYTVNKVNEIFGTGVIGDFNFVVPTGQTVGNRQNKSNMTCYTILTTNPAGTVPYYIEFYVPIFPNDNFTFFYFLPSSKREINVYGHYNGSDTVNVPNYFEWYIYGADGNIVKSGTYTFSGDNTTNYRWKGSCASSVAFIPSNTGDYVNTDKMVILNDVPTKPDSITTRYTRPTTEGYSFGTSAIAIPFAYTINSGVDTSSPWRALNNKVTALEISKQNTLTAGANITIVDNVISASGGETTPAFKEISVTLTDTYDSSNTITGYLDIWRMGAIGWFNFMPNNVPEIETSRQYKVNIPIANLAPVFNNDDISKQGGQFDKNCFRVPTGLYEITSIFKCHLSKFPNDNYIQLYFEFDSNTSGTGISTGNRLFNIF